ncbi:Pyrroline-5-carboxylate reductase 3 [Acropora cervicornis]|uniref:Pyrroline-5-carboxylate reductase 3 n=1 Tax=Acropora cervicornis TaxID=6130 RepID=A0AAD9V1Q4_ACRCE|nr:Pyrroline-5-carboxylate reductase 3 [Acropora cervicornis]
MRDCFSAVHVPNSYILHFPFTNLGCQTALVNKDVVESSDVVFFAVKPHLIVQVVREIAPYVNPDRHLFVTVAAAMRTEVIEQHLPPNTHLIRVQPNLACAVQCGVSAFCSGKCALEKDAQLIHKLLLPCGLNLVPSLSITSIHFPSFRTYRLKDGVSCSGGTTIAGIQTLERSALRSALIDAVETASKRATEIAEKGK